MWNPVFNLAVCWLKLVYREEVNPVCMCVCAWTVRACAWESVGCSWVSASPAGRRWDTVMTEQQWIKKTEAYRPDGRREVIHGRKNTSLYEHDTGPWQQSCVRCHKHPLRLSRWGSWTGFREGPDLGFGSLLCSVPMTVLWCEIKRISFGLCMCVSMIFHIQYPIVYFVQCVLCDTLQYKCLWLM